MDSFKNIDWEWINKNKDVDPLVLTLKSGGEKKSEIIQIECRQRAKRKLPEILLVPDFIFPNILSIQQCTSESLAKFHASLINKGERVLDMTCGLGIDSFKLAEKADKVTSIDTNILNIETARHNAQSCHIDNIDFICADSVDWLNNTPEVFDTIFIDPSRRDEYNRRCYALSDCSPDITAILDILPVKCKKLIVKLSPMLDISMVASQIRGIRDIYIIGTEKECKEIIAVVDFNKKEDFILHAITIFKDNTVRVDFPLRESVPLELPFVKPVKGDFLYLPFPSVMKCNDFNYISNRYELPLLGPNTHLFSSSAFKKDFPGTIYKIIEVMPYNKETIRDFRKKYPLLNITTRNFVLSPTELASKLKIKEGGYLQLFAVSLTDGSLQLLISEKCRD